MPRSVRRPRSSRPDRPGSSRRREAGGPQAGQATLEYTAVLAVVAAVLVLAGAVTGVGGISNAVARGFERALCIVGGGDCYATERQACTLNSSETAGRIGVELSFVALGGRMSLLRQKLSDGTVTITLVDGADVAPTAGVGAQGSVRIGAHGTSGGAITTAELLVRLGRRQVWRVPGDAAADKLVHDIERAVAVGLATHAVPGIDAPVRLLTHLVGVDLPKLPPADETGFSAGLKGVIELRLAHATWTEGMEASLGGARDRATGRVTVVLALETSVAGELAAAVGGLGVSSSTGVSATVTLDRSGKPLDLAVSVTGTPRSGGLASVGLPSHRKATAGGAERVEQTTHLDLTRPDNLAVYAGLMHGLNPHFAVTLPSAVLRLAAQLGRAGRQDVTVSVTHTGTYGAEAGVGLGARAGGGVELSRTVTVLEDASSRPAGGVWERRIDCLPGGVHA